MPIPKGIAVLSSDVVDSTKLWRSYPRRMANSIARQNALFQSALDEKKCLQGNEIGDQWLVYCKDPTAILSWALQALSLLHRHEKHLRLSRTKPFVVRIGIEWVPHAKLYSYEPLTREVELRNYVHTKAAINFEGSAPPGGIYFGPRFRRLKLVLPDKAYPTPTLETKISTIRPLAVGRQWFMFVKFLGKTRNQIRKMILGMKYTFGFRWISEQDGGLVWNAKATHVSHLMEVVTQIRWQTAAKIGVSFGRAYHIKSPKSRFERWISPAQNEAARMLKNTPTNSLWSYKPLRGIHGVTPVVKSVNWVKRHLKGLKPVETTVFTLSWSGE